MNLRLTLFQYDIIWENKKQNLLKVESILSELKGKTDILLLPEMFTTGFSIKNQNLAETIEDLTITTLIKWSEKYDIALIGSYMAQEVKNYYNRAFFITPRKQCYFYDKRHLFRLGGEYTAFTPGVKQLIVNYKEWNISLMICYDLRFPVWCRNTSNKFDIQLFCANWPESRITTWNTLLKARAIENEAYVIGINRIGLDDSGIYYSGNSQVIDYKGNMISSCGAKEQALTVTISKNELQKFREKFPVWKDTDQFILQIE